MATDQGANIVTMRRWSGLNRCRDGIRVISTAGEIETRCLVNSAGLFSDEIAAMLGSKMAEHRIYPVRGEYCELVRSKQNWVNGLVYPMPHADGLSLGTHLTKTLGGNVLLGPTARYIDDKNDYERNRIPVEDFARGAKQLLPAIEPSDLVLAYSGIRAKLVPPPSTRSAGIRKRAFADFIIQPDPQFPRVIQLIGIESPGLTSAAAIAEHVSKLAAEILA